MLFVNQIPIRLESSIEIQNLRSDLDITTSTLEPKRGSNSHLTLSLSLPLSPRIQFSARRGRADRSAAKGRRTSPSYIREYFAEQNRKRSLRLSTVYIRQRAKLAKGEAGEEGVGDARIDAFSRPLQNSFGHIICRCGQESEQQRLRSTTIFRDAYTGSAYTTMATVHSHKAGCRPRLTTSFPPKPAQAFESLLSLFRARDSVPRVFSVPLFEWTHRDSAGLLLTGYICEYRNSERDE